MSECRGLRNSALVCSVILRTMAGTHSDKAPFSAARVLQPSMVNFDCTLQAYARDLRVNKALCAWRLILIAERPVAL